MAHLCLLCRMQTMVFHKKITENGNFKMREKTETASVISAVHFFGFGDQTSQSQINSH